MSQRPAVTQLLLSLISATDTYLDQVITELCCEHETDQPNDASDATAAGIVVQARALRVLLRQYAERENALYRQRRR
jgi:hypothetical protein